MLYGKGKFSVAYKILYFSNTKVLPVTRNKVDTLWTWIVIVWVMAMLLPLNVSLHEPSIIA